MRIIRQFFKSPGKCPEFGETGIRHPLRATIARTGTDHKHYDLSTIRNNGQIPMACTVQ